MMLVDMDFECGFIGEDESIFLAFSRGNHFSEFLDLVPKEDIFHSLNMLSFDLDLSKSTGSVTESFNVSFII